MKSTLLALVAALCVLPPQTFRTSTNVVEVYATVVDRSGRLIPDLRREDFVVKDNGRVRPIEVFAYGTQPITMALMLDESPSVGPVLNRINDGAGALFSHFQPGDRAAVGAFSHLVRFDALLSADPAQRLAALPAGRPRFPSGTALWDALDAAHGALRTEVGRRVVLVLTDADDNCSVVSPEEVIARIEREGTMVYAIGIRGRTGLPARNLRDVTFHSGGYFFELRNSDDLTSTFARVAEELRHQYVLGFRPSELDPEGHIVVGDGTNRSIEVTTTRSGMTVRARRSYVASGGGGRGVR